MENSLEFCEQILKSEGYDTKDALIGLTASDLDRLEVLGRGEKSKILSAVQKLKSENNVYAAKKSLLEKTTFPTDAQIAEKFGAWQKRIREQETRLVKHLSADCF